MLGHPVLTESFPSPRLRGSSSRGPDVDSFPTPTVSGDCRGPSRSRSQGVDLLRPVYIREVTGGVRILGRSILTEVSSINTVPRV